MKLRPRSSRVRTVKLQVPLKKPKENPRARLNRRLVTSDGFVPKNNVESERNQDPVAGPSNPRRSRRIAQMFGSPASNWNCSKLELECFVAVKRLTLAEIEELKENLRNRRDNEDRNQSRPEKLNALFQVSSSPSSSSPMKIGPDSSILQLPDEVFHHILGFLTFADMKAARLVNKQWRQVTTTPLRRLSKQIRLVPSVFKCITKMGDGQFPVYRLEVQLYDDPKKTKACFPYFPAMSSWVKELSLNLIIDKWRTSLYMDMFPRDCTYQYLTHFNLLVFEIRYTAEKFWEEFTDCVQSILKKSPNLREINVTCGRHCCVILNVCRLMEYIFPESNSVGISKLRSINFQHFPLEKIHLANWSTLNLQLRKLEISLCLKVSYSANSLLAEFLETQTGTLKELTLTVNLELYYCQRPTVTFSFPRMEKLEQLRFISRDARVTLVTFPGIDYVGLFPSLKRLDMNVEGSGVDWMDFFGNNSLEPTNTMEELILPFGLGCVPWYKAKPAPMVNAAIFFPALKKLEIPARRFLTEAVYENMPNLEVLTFGGHSKPLDGIITGLGLAVLTFEGVMTDTWIEKLKTAECPSMARLQNLKTLKLFTRNWGNNGVLCFSRLSFHVFKQMRCLHTLDLDGDVQKYFTEQEGKQFLEELRERFVVR